MHRQGQIYPSPPPASLSHLLFQRSPSLYLISTLLFFSTLLRHPPLASLPTLLTSTYLFPRSPVSQKLNNWGTIALTYRDLLAGESVGETWKSSGGSNYWESSSDNWFSKTVLFSFTRENGGGTRRNEGLSRFRIIEGVFLRGVFTRIDS